MYERETLINLVPRHDTFVGIDSDGCVFNTMEMKQKLCFHPLIISHWDLEAVGSVVREVAEFVNLYSRWRGSNRFIALIKMADCLRERSEVVASGIRIPAFESLRRFVASGVPLSNASLKKVAAETGDEEFRSVLEWSRKVNACIEQITDDVKPFRWVRNSLIRIRAHSDAICVSQTPTEALAREWEAHGLTRYVAAIAGQELGSKAEHLILATRGKYDRRRILMIGDAPGDMAAAEEADALFYPIRPGREEESWRQFYEEAYDRFLAGTYAGAYQKRLKREFESLLPSTPPWK